LTVAEEQVRRHLAVVGNAAHTLHPVAGQGFNLSLRDLARLTESIVAGCGRNLTPGDPRVLDTYAREQAGDQARTILFSDALPRFFGRRNPVEVAGRNLGLITLDLVSGLRREFGRFGAGLMARGVGIRESL
jgi:2-polyprenyl-6-methoxyphenol hydroxylase-like FAD-dependent oxidoreductase